MSHNVACNLFAPNLLANDHFWCVLVTVSGGSPGIFSAAKKADSAGVEDAAHSDMRTDYYVLWSLPAGGIFTTSFLSYMALFLVS